MVVCLFVKNYNKFTIIINKKKKKKKKNKIFFKKKKKEKIEIRFVSKMNNFLEEK